MDIKDIRDDYTKGSLDEEAVPRNPIALFGRWLHEAIETDPDYATAMTLCTATAENKPSARVVLLKGVDEEGFRFFSSYESRKAVELAANPNGSLLFFWKELERQVRLDGVVSKLSREKSRQYFYDRPRGSQLSAVVSPQSQEVPDRAYLDELWHDANESNKEGEVPYPQNWGGYALIPHTIEFWQGRPNRMHDRLVYTQRDHQWNLKRLAP